MYKRKLFGIVCFVFLLTFSSCKKYLDLKPQDGIIRDNYWKTKEQLHSSVIGCYASLLGGPAEYFFYWGELRGGMLTTAAVVNNNDLDIMSWNILPSNNIANWRSIYATINYCNTVIKFAPEVIKSDKTLSEASLNAYVAEAKALRALMYFYLVRTFDEVPLKLKPTSSDLEIEQLAKSPQAEVLAQIVKDLQEAEPALPTTYGNQAADKGRITQYAVNAIQADVYLWMEKYNECIAACNKVIQSGKFGLVPGINFFQQNFVIGNSNESIFEIQFDQQKTNPFYRMFWRPARYMAPPSATDELYGVDVSNPNNKDYRGDGAAVRFSDGVIWKYIGTSDNNTSIRSEGESFAHWIVYRYADIYLMKAEALNQIDGKQAEALEIVKLIRQRANALPATERAPGNDKDAIADYILEERAREFAYEGKRWFDIVRNTKRNNYARLNDVLIPVVSASVRPENQQAAITKAKDKNSHYLPIHEYELQTDKNLVQNPFYK